MGIKEMDRRAMFIMDQWDPFSMGSGSYQQEIASVVEQLHLLDDPSSLAKEIQRIYEISHAQWIPLEKCVEISYKLLALKFKAKSII